jgi:hypothetical protein
MGVNEIYPQSFIENNSGQGENSVVPDIVAKPFSWGAFFFTWIWGIVYKKWVTLLVFPIALIPYLGLVVVLGLQIWFGVEGNKWAWQAKRYEGIDEFHQIHKKWAIWGWVFNIFGVVLTTVGIIFILMMPAVLPTLLPAMFNTSSVYTDNFRSAAVRLAAAPQKAYNEKNHEVRYNLDSMDDLTYNIFYNMKMAQKKSNGFIDENGVRYAFVVVNSGCYDDIPCAKILVDVNGDAPPNEYTTSMVDIKDRFVLYLSNKSVQPEEGSVEQKILSKNEPAD